MPFIIQLWGLPRVGKGEMRVPHTIFITSIFLKVNTHHSNYMREKKNSILLTSISVQQIFVTHCRFITPLKQHERKKKFHFINFNQCSTDFCNTLQICYFPTSFYGDVAHLKRNLFSSFLPHYFISFGYHLIQSSNFDDMVC